MAYPQNLPLDAWRDPTLRALWQQMSPGILANTVDAADTFTIYNHVFTVASVSNTPWPMVVVTDENGISYSLPFYSAPNA